MMKMWVVLFLVVMLSCSQGTAPKKDAISFHKGYTFWKNATEDSSYSYDVEEVIAGIRAASLGQLPRESEDEVVGLWDQFERTKMEQNLADANRILNSLNEEWIQVEPHKLYYQRIHPGMGSSLPANNAINVTYRISVLDNGSLREVFSTGDCPVIIHFDDTIPGFSRGAAGMLEGERRIIYMHPDLASDSYPEFSGKLIMIEVERQ